MFRLSTLSAAVLAGLTTMAATQIAAQTSVPSFAEDGELAVCTTASFPPLTYRASPEDPTPIGIDIDIVTEMASRFGAELRFQTTEFTGLLPSLAAGRCDLIISGIYINDQRRESFSGISYMRSTTVIVTSADDDTINAPEDLSGKIVALESGAFYRDAQIAPLNAQLREAGEPEVEVRDYPTPQEASQQVMIGRVDATISEGTEAAFRINQAGGGLRIAYVYPASFTYGIYIQPDDANTAAVVATLTAMKADGFFDALAQEYGLDPSVFDVDYDS